MDMRHWKIEETTDCDVYVVTIRKGQAFWIGEIRDLEKGVYHRTRICESQEEAYNEALVLIARI